MQGNLTNSGEFMMILLNPATDISGLGYTFIQAIVQDDHTHLSRGDSWVIENTG